MNDIDMLNKWGWIDKERFLWWNFNYPKEKRKYFENVEDFLKEFKKVGEVNGKEIKVATSDYVPVSKLILDIDQNKVEFMLTARPFTAKEMNQYFSEWTGFKPYPREFYINYNTQKNKGCIEHLKELISKEGFYFADHFLPHIRGIVKEVNEDSIFYYSMYNKSVNGEKSNRNELIAENLKRAKLDILPDITSSYGYHDSYESVRKSLKYCKENNLVYTVTNRGGRRLRKPVDIHKSFKETIYDKINLNGNQFAYYPLLIEGYKEAIPFFICNNYYGEKGLFNLGVYLGNSFYPITDKELLKKSSEELSARLKREVQPIYFTNIKGTLQSSKI
jgi:hypothetical protein